MLPVVVVSRVAVAVGGVPTAEWTASRHPLITQVSAPSVRRLAGEVAWVWLCHPSRESQVLEMASTIEPPTAGIHVVTVEGMFDQPQLSQVEPIHPGSEDFVTVRLDSDDALIGDVVSAVFRMPADRRTMYDFGCGYQLSWPGKKLIAVEPSPIRQGPFLARVNHGRDKMIDGGGHHRHTRDGRAVIRISQRAWIQVVHGHNIANQLRAPRPFARIRGLPTHRVRGKGRTRVLESAGITDDADGVTIVAS